MSALGKLDNETIKLAARLDIPHHEGAGGVEDFDNRESIQKHVRRVRNRSEQEKALDPVRPCVTLSVIRIIRHNFKLNIN